MACKFKTQFDAPEVQPVASGSGMTPVYSFVINEKTGREELKKTGETNTYEIIQAHLEQTKIENILARATLDPTVLMQKEGMYEDATQLPTSLLDAQIKVMGIKNEFEQLPNDIRQKFNYSVGEYIAQYGSKIWADALGLTQEETKQITEPAKEVVKAAEEGAQND